MSEEEGGVSMDDLLDYARQSQEIGDRYKVSGDQHIMHLLASVAKEAEAEFGANGLEMVRRAVSRFGEERGRRIARLVGENGKPLTLMNFFLHSDLDISGNKMFPELVNGELHVRVTKCRLADKLKELGLEEYGKNYCIPVDTAMLRGYNPKLELEVRSRITTGADCCLFVYRQPKGAVGSGGEGHES